MNTKITHGDFGDWPHLKKIINSTSCISIILPYTASGAKK